MSKFSIREQFNDDRREELKRLSTLGLMLNHLILRHFRNYEHAEVSFSPSINIIHGDNGQGKSNLLEAIYLVSTGRSFRTSRLCDLIRSGSTYFYLEAHFTKDTLSQILKIFYDEKKRKVEYNNTLYTTLTSVLGILPGVLLSPDDHALISGSPTERRRFIDMLLAQMDPLYLHHLGRYFKALKQRNHLLRHKNSHSLTAWEQMMAPSAAYIMTKRNTALLDLKSPLHKWMDYLSLGKDTLDMTYASSIAFNPPEDLSQHLSTRWFQDRPKEMHIGTTLFGPHRDDLSIQISEKEAKTFSSEGQKRCGTTALRFAQWEQFYKLTQSMPLLSIDDFGIQLDPQRELLLYQNLNHFGQVFLTTPKVPSHTHSQLIYIEKGTILPSS